MLLIFLLVVINLYLLSWNKPVAFAFINSEIESSPGINIIENCYNGKDDDGDKLVDNQDKYDCFNITNSSATDSHVTNSNTTIP